MLFKSNNDLYLNHLYVNLCIEKGHYKRDLINYSFTASFNLEPALNVTAVLAAILTVSPVLGLRPSLASLFEVANVPNPTNETFSPFFRVS